MRTKPLESPIDHQKKVSEARDAFPALLTVVHQTLPRSENRAMIVELLEDAQQLYEKALRAYNK